MRPETRLVFNSNVMIKSELTSYFNYFPGGGGAKHEKHLEEKALACASQDKSAINKISSASLHETNQTK